MSQPRFHLAIPVDDLDAARQFYGGVLRCPQGREADTWVDWDLYGHQLVTHLSAGAGDSAANPVDGHDVPVPHFGVLLDVESFHELAERVRCRRDRLRDRALPPIRGTAGGAVDDVLPRSRRQCPGVQVLRLRRRGVRPLRPERAYRGVLSSAQTCVVSGPPLYLTASIIAANRSTSRPSASA